MHLAWVQLPQRTASYLERRVLDAEDAANRERDARKAVSLRAQGWKVFTIWECETHPPSNLTARMDALSKRIRGRQGR